ncbi:MAG: adenosylcobinamide-GDP ribazoletransferase [Prevotella sp.]|nr:adenosylcobinamide-GDP ribazoletransferase [Prevotella sp.]MBR7054112.1 adenosylcobinamide-GDP ribazoletransferase [Prevotella sp.]
MQKSLNTSKWYNNAWAAFIYFTRLPFYKIYEPPKSAYRAVVEFWPLTGWLTASVMAATLYLGSMVMPHALAVILAIVARLILTGAFHEDGLADFIDGFGGGGSDRQRVLDIMKDSHIGAYGVIGLVNYFALLFLCLWSLPPQSAALAIIAADPFSKMLAGQVVQMLPYARNENEAKSKVVYRKVSIGSSIALAFQGLLPAIPLFLFGGIATHWELEVFIPCIVMYFLYMKIYRTLHGYTGDCCGAIFLLLELTIYLTLCITNYNTMP